MVLPHLKKKNEEEQRLTTIKEQLHDSHQQLSSNETNNEMPTP